MEPSSLETIHALKAHYRSGVDDLQRDFFTPCLSKCTEYRRGAGYFTSSALVSWVGALPRVLTMRPKSISLLVAPVLLERDRDALRSANNPVSRGHGETPLDSHGYHLVASGFSTISTLDFWSGLLDFQI